MNWKPISQAEHGKEPLLVNDTTGTTTWCATTWCSHPEWSGWIYDDDVLNDANPTGPQPTHFLEVPPFPPAPGDPATRGQLSVEPYRNC